MDINEFARGFTHVYQYDFEKRTYGLKEIVINPVVTEDMFFFNCLKGIIDGIVANEQALEYCRIFGNDDLSLEEKELQMNEFNDFIETDQFNPLHFEYKNGGNDIPIQGEGNGLMLCEYREDMYSFIFYHIDLADLLDTHPSDTLEDRKRQAHKTPVYRIAFEYVGHARRFYGEEFTSFEINDSIH